VLSDSKDNKKEFSTEEDFALVQFLEEGSNLEIFQIEKLFPIYKKIVFGIEDLLNPNEAYSKYHIAKGRALLYQSNAFNERSATKTSIYFRVKK